MLLFKCISVFIISAGQGAGAWFFPWPGRIPTGESWLPIGFFGLRSLSVQLTVSNGKAEFKNLKVHKLGL